MTYYVLVQLQGPEPWVLNLDGYPTTTEVERAINWQYEGFRRGGYPQSIPSYSICTIRDGQLADIATGETIVPGRGPYTEAAWAAFLEGHGL